MEMVSPDLLSDVRQLSAVFSVCALVAGLLLWLAGWWTHRFWVVLALTILGGVGGLHFAADLQATPLLAAIGVGLAAGLLALTLVRILAFFIGGLAALILAQAWLTSWDQPLLTFLTGGMIGWFLFRYWMMAATSTGGTLLVLYSGLALADKLGRLDAVAWSGGNTNLLNMLAGCMAMGGFAVQFFGDWIYGRLSGETKSTGKKEKKSGKKKDEEILDVEPVSAFRRAS